MYAMMQCKSKSENLAHILGYQIWAVTNLPPLQKSRPEIPRVGRGMPVGGLGGGCWRGRGA